MPWSMFLHSLHNFLLSLLSRLASQGCHQPPVSAVVPDDWVVYFICALSVQPETLTLPAMH